MAFVPERVRVVTFDSFSTLVDVGSAASVLEGHVADPPAVAREWHFRAFVYGMIGNHIGVYRTYYGLHRDALAAVLAERGVEVGERDLDALTAVYHDLEPFGDVADGLGRLAEAGYAPAVLSNGDPDMLASLVETTGIEGTVSATISADEIEAYKPAAELYEHAADRVGEPPGRIAHVSAGQADVQGAMHAGMQGVRLNRTGEPTAPFGPAPDLTVGSIHELADALA